MAAKGPEKRIRRMKAVGQITTGDGDANLEEGERARHLDREGRWALLLNGGFLQTDAATITECLYAHARRHGWALGSSRR